MNIYKIPQRPRANKESREAHRPHSLNSPSKLVHFDLYRLPEDIQNHKMIKAEIGLDEALSNPNNLVVLEWPERPIFSEKHLLINFEKLPNQDHQLSLSDHHSD